MAERKNKKSPTISRNTTIYLLAVVILVLIGFALALSSLPENSNNQDDTGHENNQEVSSVYMALEHGYIADANTFSGSVESPTPCHELLTDAEISGSSPEQITLKLRTEDSGETCAQVVSEKDFTIVVPSSPNAQLVAVMLNGQRVNFNLDQN